MEFINDYVLITLRISEMRYSLADEIRDRVVEEVRDIKFKQHAKGKDGDFKLDSVSTFVRDDLVYIGITWTMYFQ